MKTLIILLVTFFSSLALACPNLSGTYRDSSNPVLLTFTQVGCESILIRNDLVNEDGTFTEIGHLTILTDGIMRTQPDNSEFTVRQMVESHFTDTALITSLVLVKKSYQGNVYARSMITTTTRSDQGDLRQLSKAYNEEGTLISSQEQILSPR